MNQERPMSHLRFCCASKMRDSGAQITLDAGWRKKNGPLVAVMQKGAERFTK